MTRPSQRFCGCLLRAFWEAALGGRKMDWKAYALIVLTFVWGCRVKAVYAPLILLGLMIPAEKFRSKREMYLMKGGFIVICGLMMLSFILPVLIAPRDIGDTRGDSTSEKGRWHTFWDSRLPMHGC